MRDSRNKPHRIGRRDVLQLGAVSAVGLSLPGLLAARAAESGRAGFGTAKACILLFHFGGPAQQDTFDLKPDAPAEVRGEFRPIATSVAGSSVCEHLPMVARQAHRLAVVRSVWHDDTQHNNSGYATLTGHKHPPLPNTVEALVGPKPDDHPPFGAVLTRLRASPMPWVSLPYEMVNGVPYPGQTAGFLGARHEPLWLKFDPTASDSSAHALELPGAMTPTRLQQRAALLHDLDRTLDLAARSASAAALSTFQGRAVDLVTSAAVRRALRLDREDPRLRDRYGRNVFGQSCLMARRLVEAGMPLVAVYTLGRDGFPKPFTVSWDTHRNNFKDLKEQILPIQDLGYAMLLEDLALRGLLDETLVVWFGEFGRTPKVNGLAGRDHWPFVYTVVFAGGGVRGGMTFGASDKSSAYPASDPVTPQDVAATIYHCLGIDPATRIADRQGRPVEVACGGSPILPILA
jgi:hypothetical protein